ncbi:hypothetical protein [Candidatus Liberibacter sp.]|uniref:hypothetical protein n=1 Tax=Candidatus Liberibacter sp. TaxID=34022 RepID=UPI0015F738DF|nr:hypothetical protein [Candidatus Liberibacter sp.]MBA5724406.1 hypothetical protein [Candidatus Liberibacter sp.]
MKAPSICNRKELDRMASVARQRNVMIEFTEDGKCIRIYPEFDSRTDIIMPEEEPFVDFVI